MAELTGAPPSNRAIPGGELPVMDATFRSLSAKLLDCGDVQIALHNIGLASTAESPDAVKPGRRQIDDYIRRLVWYTTQPPNYPGNASSESARRKKIRLLLSAIRTLRGFKNFAWDQTQEINIVRRDDRATNAPTGVPTPLSWPDLRRLLARHRTGINARINAFEPVGDLQLTVRERTANSDEILGQLARYWDAFNQGGFTATDGASRTPVFHVLNWPEDGNSLWYCLCYSTYLFRNSTPEWAWVKAQIWKYFNYVIHHPSHPRHRMYVHLERQSSGEIEQRSPGSRRLWGRMSILRALHLNTPNSGPPMYGNFYGMMQVIADYFRKEVILFIRPSNARIDVLRPQYDYRVFGRRTDGQTNGQLYLVTDEVPEHFQVVTTMDQVPVDYRSRTGPQDPPNLGRFDTSHRSADDRYGWIDGPWMPLMPLPNGYEPIPLANPPMLDPLFTVPFNSDECWQFSGRGEAVDDDPRYGKGAMPILPDPVTSGWATETLAPIAGPAPYPAFPFGFSDHNIVTGVYIEDDKEWWPQWNNMLAYKANEYRELARERDLPTAPHVLSQN